MIRSLKSRFLVPVFTLATALFLFSCQKEVTDTNNPVIPTTPADLTTKVNAAKVSGFVTDENNAPVVGASVKVGTTATTTTDDYGYFEVRNAEVVKNAAVVTVTKTGYFKGIKTFIGADGKSAFFRIKLIPKTVAGTVNGTSGGDVTLANGLKISFPANGVMVDGSGAAYSGTVNVAAYWINPTGSDLPLEMPGDLRALNTDDEFRQLTTYGMVAVELTGATGEALQVATGKKATLTMPIPSSILSSAPASIALWHFDEAKGLWIEEGTATKTGNTYVGDVSHFSFWNCDLPNDYVQFNCTIVDQDGNPVPYAVVKISVVSNPQNQAYGWTDSSGYVSGAIPDNASLLMEVFSYYQCGTAVYSQTFTTTNTNVSLGNITINTSVNSANLTGTVTDCSNMPVSNGAIMVQNNGYFTRYPVSSTGSFDFNVLLCSNASANLVLIAEDYAGGQQSPNTPFTAAAGNNNVGNLQACGVQIAEFLNLTVDANTTNYAPPADSLTYFINPQTTPAEISIYAFGTRVVGGNTISTYSDIAFTQTGIAAGSTQNLTRIGTNTNGAPTSQYVISTPINVNITEYGAIGEFVAGNFTGQVTIAGTTNTANVTCNFRVRRTQ